MLTTRTAIAVIIFCTAVLTSCDGPTAAETHTAGVSITDRWHFRKYLEDPSTPENAKLAFRDESRADEKETPVYIERLCGDDTDAHAFYFRVLTNSYNKKGVTIPEELATAAYRYVMANPGEFADYFAGEDAFTDVDLTAWSDIVLIELERMTADQYGRPVIETYLDSLESNCHNSTAQQQRTLRRFGRHLTEGWQRYLMNVEQ